MDKFIMRPTPKADGYKPCILDTATHEKLSQLKEMTGVPMTRIIAIMTDFCMERLEIQED